MDHVIVYETHVREEAIVIESALKSSGIDCIIDGENSPKIFDIATASFGAIRVMVPEEDADDAMELIEAATHAMGRDEEDEG